MINSSITYLRNSDELAKTILIGGVLSILSILLIPAFIVSGYLVRVLRSAIAGEAAAPAFGEWGELFVDGLKAFVIAFVYGLVPAVVGFVLVGGSVIATFSTESGSAGLIGGVGLLFGLAVSVVLGLAAWYLIPAATANFATTGRLSAGFDIGALRPVVTSKRYATGWLLALGVVVLAGIVAGMLNVIPVLGTIVGVFVSFAASVVAYHIIGRTWADLQPIAMRDNGMIDDQPVV
jgi:hypothetical protein